MRDVQEIDLRSSARLVTLFGQAERKMMVKSCDADKLAFFAAAEHALRIGTRNIGGLFASIVRGGDYGSVSQDDEDRARKRLGEYRQRIMSNGLRVEPPGREVHGSRATARFDARQDAGLTEGSRSTLRRLIESSLQEATAASYS